MDIKALIVDLREDLVRWAHAYYKMETPMVSDSKYDRVMEQLKTMEKWYPEYATADSPTGIIGAALDAPSGGMQVILTKPMLSLDNTFSHNQTKRWVANIIETVNVSDLKDKGVLLVGEPKLDGMAVSVVYKHGVLDRAASRGNGHVGADLTARVMAIKGVPTSLKTDNPPDAVEVRGEIVMRKSVMDELNKRREILNKPNFINTRAAVSGSMKLTDYAEISKRNLSVFFYAIGSHSDDVKIDNQIELLRQFKRWGLPVADNSSALINTSPRMYAKKTLKARESLDYEIDGVVFKVYDFKQRAVLGESKTTPNWAMAEKFPATEETTTVIDIVDQVGAGGRITPVALLDPVKIDNVTVTSASLYNYESMERLGIAINDTVMVKRAGDVIPAVTGVTVTSSKRIICLPPTVCPSCNSKVVVDGSYLRCNNPECRGKLLAKLAHFVSKEAMDISGIAERTIETLYDLGLVKYPSSLYALAEALKDSEVTVYGFGGELSALNFRNAIDASKNTTTSKFLFSLAIPSVGSGLSVDLAASFDDFDSIRNATYNDLIEMDGVGETTANAILSYFASPINKGIIDDLLKVITLDEDAKFDGSLKGMVYVLTGSYDFMKRSEVKKALIERGAVVRNNVSKKTTMLITGRKFSKAKVEKAHNLGIEVADESVLPSLV